MATMTGPWVRSARFLPVAMAYSMLTLAQNSSAAIIAYEGFKDGGLADGRAPGAVAYTTSPVSTNGLDRDSLHAQSPLSIGFPDDSEWSVAGSLATSNLYFEVQKGGLMYTNFAPMTSGQARLVTGSATAGARIAKRDAATTNTNDIQWVALLVNFNSAPSTSTWDNDFVVSLEYGEPSDNTEPYDGAWTPATFGVRQSDGKAFYKTAVGSGRVDVESASSLSAGTHLFLLKFDDRAGTNGVNRYDDVTLWVDPVLTADPDKLTGGLSAVSIMRSDLGGGMHAFDEVMISGRVMSGNEILFDEFIITDDYADIRTPVKRAVFQTADATYIRSSTVNGNFNDSGQMIVGQTTSDILRGLIEFDISLIPAADQITSASLLLTTYSASAGINNVGGPGDYTTFKLYSYGFDIDEKTATWHAPDVKTNDVAGGTSGPLLTSASIDVEAPGLRVTFGDTAAFRTAVKNARKGDGVLRLILRGDSETIGAHNFARFSDETDALLVNRPELLVSYLTVPLGGTLIRIH